MATGMEKPETASQATAKRSSKGSMRPRVNGKRHDDREWQEDRAPDDRLRPGLAEAVARHEAGRHAEGEGESDRDRGDESHDVPRQGSQEKHRTDECSHPSAAQGRAP